MILAICLSFASAGPRLVNAQDGVARLRQAIFLGEQWQLSSVAAALLSGIPPGPRTHASDGGIEEGYGDSAENGFNLIKLQVQWAVCEPEEGQFDFSKYEELIAHAKKLGMKVYVGITCEQAPSGCLISIPIVGWSARMDCRSRISPSRPCPQMASQVLASTIRTRCLPRICFFESWFRPLANTITSWFGILGRKSATGPSG